MVELRKIIYNFHIQMARKDVECSCGLLKNQFLILSVPLEIGVWMSSRVIQSGQDQWLQYQSLYCAQYQNHIWVFFRKKRANITYFYKAEACE